MGRSESAVFTNMCMIYDNNGNILVINRKNPDWPGVTFPGGHVEKGESFVESVVREVKEETGLDIDNPQLCGSKQFQDKEDNRYVVLFYKTNRFSGQLKSSDEGEVFFSSIENLKKMELSPNFDKYLTMFLSDDHFEIFCNWNEEMKKNGEPQWNFQFH